MKLGNIDAIQLEFPSWIRTEANEEEQNKFCDQLAYNIAMFYNLYYEPNYAMFFKMYYEPMENWICMNNGTNVNKDAIREAINNCVFDDILEVGWYLFQNKTRTLLDKIASNNGYRKNKTLSLPPTPPILEMR